MIVFIGCVKSKRNERSMAKDLYTSPLFKYSLKYAQSLTTDDKIFILSAKYGVLKLTDVIEPYELCLNNMSKYQRQNWALKCYKQMQNFNFNEQTIFLCGASYRENLLKYFKNYQIPLKNISFGKQLQFYRKVLS